MELHLRPKPVSTQPARRLRIQAVDIPDANGLE